MQQELRQLIPNSEVLIALEPEELGIQIVQAAKLSRERMFNSGAVFEALFGHPNDESRFPRNHRAQAEGAIFEAWSWLEAQGLIVWADTGNGPNGWRKLSRRAQRIEAEELVDFVTALQLPRELLHSIIRERVWGDFVRGHYDDAVLFAARQVEIRVREAIGVGDDRYGVTLMTDAFHEENGVLTDLVALVDERRARRNLFIGFVGAYKNPLSHRDLDIDEPHEAIELVLMASHLLRIVDLRVDALQEANRA